MTSLRRPPVERTTSSYLGYPLVISNEDVTVLSPAGRRLCRCSSVKQARLVVRSWRRMERAAG